MDLPVLRLAKHHALCDDGLRCWIFRLSIRFLRFTYCCTRPGIYSRGPCLVKCTVPRLVIQGGDIDFKRVGSGVGLWSPEHALEETASTSLFLLISFSFLDAGERPFYPMSLCCDAPSHRLKSPKPFPTLMIRNLLGGMSNISYLSLRMCSATRALTHVCSPEPLASILSI